MNEEEHQSKRVKFDVVDEADGKEEVNVKKDVQLRMNAHIHLCFHLPKLHIPYHILPSFTHQLFENEEMTLPISYAKQVQVEVHVDCVNLLQEVHVLNVLDEEKRQEMGICLQKGLPEDTIIHYGHHSVTCQHSVFQKHESDTSSTANPSTNSPVSLSSGSAMLGTELRKFSVDNDDFVVTHCQSDDQKAAFCLQRLEKLAMWFIETADSVDFYQNPQWEVLFLYQRHHVGESVVFSYAGYVTLYSFHTPLCGSRLRLCQILILPQYQSKGLGREMVLEVYALAKRRSEMIEVTVEDPCVGFQRLREVVDVEWALSAEEGTLTASFDDLKNRIAKVLAKDDEALGYQLKIIKSQVLFVKEALQYLLLVFSLATDLQSSDAAVAEDNKKEEEDKDCKDGSEVTKLSSYPLATKLKWLHQAVKSHSQFAYFRLKAKRNLLKLHKDLKYLEKPTMQKELTRLFEESLQHYHHVLRAIVRLDLLPSSLLEEEALCIYKQAM